MVAASASGLPPRRRGITRLTEQALQQHPRAAPSIGFPVGRIVDGAPVGPLNNELPGLHWGPTLALHRTGEQVPGHRITRMGEKQGARRHQEMTLVPSSQRKHMPKELAQQQPTKAQQRAQQEAQRAQQEALQRAQQEARQRAQLQRAQLPLQTIPRRLLDPLEKSNRENLLHHLSGISLAGVRYDPSQNVHLGQQEAQQQAEYQMQMQRAQQEQAHMEAQRKAQEDAQRAVPQSTQRRKRNRSNENE